MTFEEFVLYLVLPAFGLYALVSVLRLIRKTREASGVWETFALSQGLQKAPAPITDLSLFTWQNFRDWAVDSSFVSHPGSGMKAMKGENAGMPFLMEILPVKRKWINWFDIYTRMVLNVPELPDDLRLFPKSVSPGLLSAFTGQDIETGDREFDRTFTVKGEDAEAVRDYLNPDRRASLLQYQTGKQGVFLNDGKLFLLVPGRGGGFSDLSRLFSQVGDLGEALKSH